MSMVAPQARQHRSAAALFRVGRSGFANIPEHRCDDVDIACTEARLAAFAMVALTFPSLLALDTQRGEGNVDAIDGIARAPCDTPLRETLEPVSPESLRPSFQSVLRQLQGGKGLEEMPGLAGHSFVALEGTGDCSSKPRHWVSCLPKGHRNGSITSYHQM
jgi:hypothetical protein